MKIQINAHYIHENNLARVIGVHALDTLAPQFLIEWFVWKDGKDERHTKTVDRYELQPAPTMERLYSDWRAALDVICQQANMLNNAPVPDTILTAYERWRDDGYNPVFVCQAIERHLKESEAKTE